ncbi:hypothetical protein PV326_004718 [Microctonus aethiopoides]|nr:hypothetical protein PV326_004718 [Microctonus aethiopoides]
MLIVRLIFLLFSHGVYSSAQYSNESDVNSIKSDNRTLLSIPMTFINTTESSKVLGDNRVNIQNQISRDLNVINKTLSDTDSFVSLNNTSDNFNVSDHNDTYTQNKNNTIVTSINYPNAAVGSLEKYSINTPTTHGTIIAMKMNTENNTDYSNKLVNVSDVKTHSSQLANDTKGSDKLKENSKNSNSSFHTTWKKRHVDQSATRILGQTSYEKNPSVHSENIKNVLYLKSVNITHDNGEVENLICTKLEIIPENYRRSIIRKIDRFMKKTLAKLKINHPRNGDNNNNNNEEKQDHNDNNNDDDYDDDDDDDDEDEYEDDDDDDCGCGCRRRRRCCRCRKCKRRKCPSCEKIVTPPPESGRRSGATFPINFESSEVIETTTPLETESPVTITSTIPTLTTSSTTSLQFITTSPTPTPSTTTTPSTTQYSTTSTTPTPSTTQYPTTSSSTTTTTTTKATTIPSTTQHPTTSSTSTTSTTTTTTTATTIPTTITTTTPTTTAITTAELLATKKRNIKRKKCTKKKRRKEELKLLNNANGNSTLDNDKEFNSSQPNRVPFSGLFENQYE